MRRIAISYQYLKTLIQSLAFLTTDYRILYLFFIKIVMVLIFS
jgi:hypothetical protein